MDKMAIHMEKMVFGNQRNLCVNATRALRGAEHGWFGGRARCGKRAQDAFNRNRIIFTQNFVASGLSHAASIDGSPGKIC
jgi:hypothetical protein